MQQIVTPSMLKSFKETSIANQMIPRKFHLSEIKLIDNETVEIKKAYLGLEPKAFKDIIGILGMTEKVLKVFDNNFGLDKTKQMINMIQDNLSRSGVEVVMYADPKAKSIARIVPENKQILGLSLDTYFNTLDRMLNDNPGFVIKRTTSDVMTTQVDLIDPKAEFRVGKMNLETFHPGLSFATSFNKPTYIQNFTERLVCTNGMTHRDTQTAYALNDNFTKDQWLKFFNHIENIKSHGWISPKFSEQIEKAMDIPASLGEMYTAAALIRSTAGNDVDLWVPITETTNRFKGIGVDTDTLNETQASTAKTGQSVWQLINAVTDYASHDHGFKISNAQRIFMQVQAGKMLMKERFDMQNIVTKTPF